MQEIGKERRPNYPKRWKDEGISGWITFTSPEDLVKFDVEVNFNKFNYLPLMFNDDVNVSNSDVDACVSSCSSSEND